MCRLAAIVSKDIQLLHKIDSMRDSMYRGGPDDAGKYIDSSNGVALGHRRLSLLDVSSAAAQPMHDTNGRYQLIFNGELYNYQELKSDLLALGYHFKSHSDTEVVLYAFIAWGVAAFEKFNAMFALAIYDTVDAILTIARDEVGIKPLYYYHQSSTFLIASELRAFKTINSDWPKDVNWSIYFLAFGFIPEPLTQLKDVFALAPGHYLQLNINRNTCKQDKYTRTRKQVLISDEYLAIQQLRTQLTASVKRQLVVDAPIGVFLSGGIDSSVLTFLASCFKDNLKTLSIAFDHKELNEEFYQKAVADAYGTEHYSFKVNASNFYEHLDDIKLAMDQPSNDGVNTYFISKYARQIGLKTVLSGIGADELLGGYPSFKHVGSLHQLAELPFFTIQVALQFLSADKWKRLSYLYTQKQNNFYLVNRGIFPPSQIASILGCSLQDVKFGLNQLQDIPIDNDTSLLEQNAWREFSIYMRNQLLRDADVMSMWHGLEIRVPFLDKDFLKTIASIDASIKFKPSKGKHLLINAFKSELPQAVWDRAKQGFTLPFQEWMMHMPLKNQQPNTESFYSDFKKHKLHWSKLWLLEQLT